MVPTDWDAIWETVEIPGGRAGEWREVLAYRTKLPDDAIRLAGHGWTPEQVVSARDAPLAYFGDDNTSSTTAALIVLADETAKWHESRMQVARELRWLHVRRLAAQEEPKWSHQQIGDLVGLSRQRVREIIRSKSSAVA